MLPAPGHPHSHLPRSLRLGVFPPTTCPLEQRGYPTPAYKGPTREMLRRVRFYHSPKNGIPRPSQQTIHVPASEQVEQGPGQLTGSFNTPQEVSKTDEAEDQVIYSGPSTPFDR